MGTWGLSNFFWQISLLYSNQKLLLRYAVPGFESPYHVQLASNPSISYSMHLAFNKLDIIHLLRYLAEYLTGYCDGMNLHWFTL